MTPAMTARPIAVKKGLKPPTATFVIGTENEKSRTPTKAHSRPWRTVDDRRPCSAAVPTVATPERYSRRTPVTGCGASRRRGDAYWIVAASTSASVARSIRVLRPDAQNRTPVMMNSANGTSSTPKYCHFSSGPQADGR